MWNNKCFKIKPWTSCFTRYTRQANSIRTLTFHTNIVKSPAGGVLRVTCPLCPLLLSNENPAWKLSCRDALHNRLSPFFGYVCPHGWTAYGDGRVSFLHSDFSCLSSFEIRIPDWRVDVTCSNSTMLGWNLFSPFPLYFLLFVSVWFSIRPDRWEYVRCSAYNPPN